MNWSGLSANNSAQEIEEKIAELMKQLADIEQEIRQARKKTVRRVERSRRSRADGCLWIKTGALSNFAPVKFAGERMGFFEQLWRINRIGDTDQCCRENQTGIVRQRLPFSVPTVQSLDHQTPMSFATSPTVRAPPARRSYGSAEKSLSGDDRSALACSAALGQ